MPSAGMMTGHELGARTELIVQFREEREVCVGRWRGGREVVRKGRDARAYYRRGSVYTLVVSLSTAGKDFTGGEVQVRAWCTDRALPPVNIPFINNALVLIGQTHPASRCSRHRKKATSWDAFHGSACAGEVPGRRDTEHRRPPAWRRGGAGCTISPLT